MRRQTASATSESRPERSRLKEFIFASAGRSASMLLSGVVKLFQMILKKLHFITIGILYNNMKALQSLPLAKAWSQPYLLLKAVILDDVSDLQTYTLETKKKGSLMRHTKKNIFKTLPVGSDES